MKSFELSEYTPLNTILTDLDNGEKAVCISSPRNFTRGTTKISFYTSAPSARESETGSWDPQPAQDGAPQSDSESPRLEERARVNWNFFTGSWVVYRGEIITVAKLMPPTNFTKA